MDDIKKDIETTLANGGVVMVCLQCKRANLINRTKKNEKALEIVRGDVGQAYSRSNTPGLVFFKKCEEHGYG